MVTSKTRSTTFWITGGAFFGFFLQGFVDNMRGGTIPGMLAETGFSYSAGGGLVLGQFLGFVLAALLCGIVADRLGKRTIMILAGVLYLAGVYGYASSHSHAMFLAAFFLIGLGSGALELGANTTIASVHGADSGKYLNFLACFHGVGSTAAPLFVGILLQYGASWRLPYQLSLAVAFAYLAYTFCVRYPAEEAHAREAPAAFREIARQALSGRLPYLYLLVFAYVAVEIGLATWMVEFIVVEKGIRGFWAAASLSLYFGLIMAFRLIGGFFVDRIGHLNILLYCGIGGLATLAAGIFGPSRLFLLLPMTGVFHSVVFPTATAAASSLLTKNRGAILGVLFCCGGIGGMLGPWLIGVGCDVFGLKGGMCIGLAFSAFMIAAAAVIRMRDFSRRTPAEPCEAAS